MSQRVSTVADITNCATSPAIVPPVTQTFTLFMKKVLPKEKYKLYNKTNKENEIKMDLTGNNEEKKEREIQLNFEEV